VTLSARFADAVGYALEAYGGHVRKGTAIPYVSHLLADAFATHAAGPLAAELARVEAHVDASATRGRSP